MNIFTNKEFCGHFFKVVIWIVFIALDWYAFKDSIQQEKYSYKLLQEQEERKKAKNAE